MKIKTIRIEQKEYNESEINKAINSEIENIERQGFKIIEVRPAVGRDADISSGLSKRYSLSVILVYE